VALLVLLELLPQRLDLGEERSEPGYRSLEALLRFLVRSIKRISG